jgi:hypothetical protein
MHGISKEYRRLMRNGARSSLWPDLKIISNPPQLRLVYSLKNPVSQKEWDVHASIRNIHVNGEDPEALIIRANLPSVGTFLRLKDWLLDIQQELDTSWAVLGEVYGRFTKLRHCPLVRR